jgi:nucleotide-binding universal stress UspA family protein
MAFERILAYLDTRKLRSDPLLLPALHDLAGLARESGAALVLCDVVEPPRWSGAPNAQEERFGRLRVRHARQALSILAEQLRAEFDGVLECRVLDGNPFLEIARLSARESFDLVVCVGARESGPHGFATANHLVRKAPAAVWLTCLRRPRQRGHLAVAVDRDIFPAADFPQEMAHHLIEVAATLCGDGTTTVELVHAWEIYGADLVSDPEAGLDEHTLAQYIDTQRYSHTLWLEGLHERLRESLTRAGRGRVQTAIRLLEGAPESALGRWLDSAAPDLLVIGTLGTSGTAGLFIGDTAETVIGNTSVPVLAIKPPGFRSPVIAPAA